MLAIRERLKENIVLILIQELLVKKKENLVTVVLKF